MFRKTVYGTSFRDVPFVPLQSATFCVQCELISTNSTPHCLACGSRALVSLSRILGGSLLHSQTAHLITDSELDSLVRDLLRTVPDPGIASVADHHARIPSLALRSRLRLANAAHPASGFRAVTASEEIDLYAGQLDLEPAISAITERAQHLTGATGAAIALRAGDEIVCRARAGRTAPDLGVRLQTDAGISAEASAPAKSCCAMMLNVIRESIWLVAVAWASGRFWFRRCVTTVGRWVCSRFCLPLRVPSISVT